MSAQQDPIAGSRVRVQGLPVGGYPPLAPEAAQGRVRRITVVGDRILHHPCQPATEFGTEELEQLIDDMFVTMYIAEGAGLAANQVDVDLRLFVYDCHDDDGVRHVGHILNPELDLAPVKERRLVEADEGCLSVPGPRHPLFRDDRVVVRGVDKHGESLVIEGTGYFARCLLHETDHINGVVYTDHLTKRQRNLVLQEMADIMDDVFAERRERARVLEAGDLSVAGMAEALGRTVSLPGLLSGVPAEVGRQEAGVVNAGQGGGRQPDQVVFAQLGYARTRLRSRSDTLGVSDTLGLRSHK